MSGRHAAPAPRQRRREGLKTEGSAYAAFLARVIDNYGDRIAADPAEVAHAPGLIAAMHDAVNRGLYLANSEAAGHYSNAELGRILGVRRQSVHERVQAGELVQQRWIQERSAGRVPWLARARRERAGRMKAAAVADVTGSERERTAG